MQFSYKIEIENKIKVYFNYLWYKQYSFISKEQLLRRI
jgi:hypothetical protein